MGLRSIETAGGRVSVVVSGAVKAGERVSLVIRRMVNPARKTLQARQFIVFTSTDPLGASPAHALTFVRAKRNQRS